MCKITLEFKRTKSKVISMFGLLLDGINVVRKCVADPAKKEGV
jgi:hypothetical protein